MSSQSIYTQCTHEWPPYCQCGEWVVQQCLNKLNKEAKHSEYTLYLVRATEA